MPNEAEELQWLIKVEAFEECRLRKQYAREKGMLCFDGRIKEKINGRLIETGRQELTDYNCNLSYSCGLPVDAATIIRENQIASQRDEYEKAKNNNDFNKWLFWIVIGIVVVAIIVAGNALHPLGF